MRRGWRLTSSSEKLNRKFLGILDSIFAVSNKPISLNTFAKLLNLKKEEAKEVLKEYMKMFNSLHEGVKIIRKKNFYYLTISDKYMEYVKNYMKPPPLTEKQKTLLAYIYIRKRLLNNEN